jgi:hypothetical protein
MPLHDPSDDSGQASVEFIAVLPIIAAMLLLSWQAVLAGHTVWAATTAVRAAARAAALGGDPAAAARAHLPAALEPGLRISRGAAGAVELSLRVPRVIAAIPLGRVSATSHFRPQDAPPPSAPTALEPGPDPVPAPATSR